MVRRSRRTGPLRRVMKWLGFSSPAMFFAVVMSYFGYDAPLKFLQGTGEVAPAIADVAKKSRIAAPATTAQTPAKPVSGDKSKHIWPFHHEGKVNHNVAKFPDEAPAPIIRK